MRLRVLLPLLVLAGGVAHGEPAAPFLDAGFGPRVADLRLAVTVDQANADLDLEGRTGRVALHSLSIERVPTSGTRRR